MNHIDLIQFADHAAKIPAKFLHRSHRAESTGTMAILIAQWIDLLIVVNLTVVTGVLYTRFSQGLFIGKTIKGLSSNLPIMSFFLLLLVGLHFFSYFLNQGQTPGLKVIGKRLPMKEKSFRASFRWAMFYSMSCLSGGFLAVAFRHRIGPVSQDHLYHELIREKELQGLDLLEHTLPPHEMEEELPKAA